MKILLAPDKFKGSLTAEEVCHALSQGLKRVRLDAKIISRPLADGGDGSLDILEQYIEVQTQTLIVQGPLGEPVTASYKYTDTTAYIEMSTASGLVLLKPEERNCMYTTSYGTGELISHAIGRGVKDIYLFIGGSATNDGGIGIASALGYRFLDSSGNILSPTGENLIHIASIDHHGFHIDLNQTSFRVICDVNNPFWGEEGAAYVYAAQKGANSQQIRLLDQGLRNLANCLTEQGFADISQTPGAGAAGGVGGGMMALFNANLISGINTFLRISELETFLPDCDLIITGEGKLDRQTEQGKVVSGVCNLAGKYNIPVVAVCGVAEDQLQEKLNLRQVYTVMSRSANVEEAMSKAKEKLIEIGAEIGGTNFF